MAEVVKDAIEVSLVLQGGGALGAYEWGAVTGLLELMDEAEAQGKRVALKAVSGVSIGAVSAACVVGSSSRANARARLDALWNALALDTPDLLSMMRIDLSHVGLPNINAPRDLSLWGLPGFYSPRTDILNFAGWTSYYDTRPFLATLARHIDFAALNASATRFIVSAVNVRSGILTRFRNYPVTETEVSKDSAKTAHHITAPQVDKHQAIGPRHILASGSLPPAFPWTEIDHECYWDGGIVDNTPLGDVMDAFSTGDHIKRLLVVMNVYPLSARIPRNMRQVEDRIHELGFGNRVRQDLDTAQRINWLTETVQALAALATDHLTDDLRARAAMAQLYKVVDVVEVDLQQPSASEPSIDDGDGLRDFSRGAIAYRRAFGHDVARRKLGPLFGTDISAHDVNTAPASANRS